MRKFVETHVLQFYSKKFNFEINEKFRNFKMCCKSPIFYKKALLTLIARLSEALEKWWKKHF